MALRSGFKSEAHAIAAEVRRDIGVGPVSRLDPWHLARHLEVPVHCLSEFRPEARKAVLCLGSVESGSFSAMTVFDGPKRLIVHNDAHAATRQASNVTHELAHAILLHPAMPALDARGCRNWDQDIEDEANFLAGALLVTPEAAFAVAKSHIDLVEAASNFGISPSMMRYRINVTGARKRVERMRSSVMLH